MSIGQEIRLASGAVVRVHTDQPNPYGAEWSAVDDNYDASYEGPEDGYVSSSPRGWGKTEAEAIADLVEQLEERADIRAELNAGANGYYLTRIDMQRLLGEAP